MIRETRPIPCEHIHAFYDLRQSQHACLGNNLLRIGYAQWARGQVDRPVNNLYQWPRGKRANEH